VKDLPAAAKTGFAEAGGMLWAAAGNKLFKINTTALTSEEVTLGDDLSVYYNQWAYTPTGLHASKKGDALYFVEGSSSGYDVYRFTIATGAAEKLFPAPEVDGTRYSVYGAGLNADPESDDLYLFYTADWGGSCDHLCRGRDHGRAEEVVPLHGCRILVPLDDPLPVAGRAVPGSVPRRDACPGPAEPFSGVRIR